MYVVILLNNFLQLTRPRLWILIIDCQMGGRNHEPNMIISFSKYKVIGKWHYSIMIWNWIACAWWESRERSLWLSESARWSQKRCLRCMCVCVDKLSRSPVDAFLTGWAGQDGSTGRSDWESSLKAAITLIFLPNSANFLFLHGENCT